MSIELKIKSKHLALEPGIIKHEEHKLKKQITWLKLRQMPADHLYSKLKSLQDHRRWDVRNEQRATFLARAFLKGTPYSKVEKTTDPYMRALYITRRVVAMVKKYSDYGNDTNVEQMIRRWYQT